MKKTAFLLILSTVWLMSAFQTAAAIEPCVEGVKSSGQCAPVKAKRIIYNCPSGFVLAFSQNGYVCWRESTFQGGGNISLDGYVPNSYEIKRQTSFPCEPRNVPQDPETGKCMLQKRGRPYDYYCQINAYQVTNQYQIYNADNAEEMSRLHTYGTGRYSGWNAAISCDQVIPNCSICDGTPVCSECNLGYVLQDGQCVKKAACPANCSECDSSGACTKCADGYELKNGACAVKAKKQIAFCPPDKTLSDDLCCCISK